MFIERRRDLVRRTIVHCPHRSNHRTEPSELHRRREMDHLVQTLFVSDSRMTCREIRKFGVLQIALDDASDCKVSVVQSKRGLERLFPIWETMTRRWTHSFLPSSSTTLEVQDSSPSIRMNVARPSTRGRMLASSAPTERSSLSPVALAWPMARKRFCSVADFDGLRRLARMRAVRVGV
jgi:hypothetical protein